MAEHRFDWRRTRRLAPLLVGSVLAVGPVLFVLPWIPVWITPSRLRRVAIALLLGIKLTAGVVLVGGLIGVIVLGGLWFRARQTGKRRPLVARGLLLCGTCLIGLSLADAIAATWGVPRARFPRNRHEIQICQSSSPNLKMAK